MNFGFSRNFGFSGKFGLVAAFGVLGWMGLSTAALTQAPAAAPAPAAALAKAPHLGQWSTEGGKSLVEVTECAPGICANIVWQKDPNDEAGKPLRDGYNKNTQMRTRAILGLPLFENMRPAKNGWEGRIYNPEEGEWYDVNVWLAGPDKINIKGCVLFICETHPWTRAVAPAAAMSPAAQAPAAPPKRIP